MTVDSDIASSQLLRAAIYPDSTEPEDRVEYAYNRLGERKQMADQRGTLHDYEFDGLGRQIHDRVTTLGAGVDGAVRRISQTYDVRGLVETITSYDAAIGGDVVNEVKRVYNDLAQMVQEFQSHAGVIGVRFHESQIGVKQGKALDGEAFREVFTQGMAQPSDELHGALGGPSDG